MGNSSPKIDENKECIFWLDQKVFNDENKITYQLYQKTLENFNFLCYTSVDSLFSFIEKNLKYFEFRLFYIVVSGSLAEDFFREYVKMTEKYNIIAASIVYCLHPIYHEMKPYFKDKFLNSGGVTCDFEEVVNYILKDECNWRNIHQTYKEYNPGKDNYGDVFMYMDTRNEYELALPILIGKTINSSLIEKGEIEKFQELLLSRYCYSYNQKDFQLIKPSGNKNMNIPLHILTKFFIKFYTSESSDGINNFYKQINLDLTNNKFDEYHPFIFLIYDSLNKGYLKSYNGKLYRGGKLLKSEFNKIISEKNKCINKNYNALKKKLTVNYCMSLKSSPDNNYFSSIIVSNFYSKIKIDANLKDQIGAHLDDEILNNIEEYRGSNQKKNENIIKFFDKHLK